MPAEVKTQVMKHAALLDVDLLCCLESDALCEAKLARYVFVFVHLHIAVTLGTPATSVNEAKTC